MYLSILGSVVCFSHHPQKVQWCFVPDVDTGTTRALNVIADTSHFRRGDR